MNTPPENIPTIPTMPTPTSTPAPTPTPPTSPALPQLLDVHAVAAAIGVHPKTIRRLCAAGKLPPPIRLGLRVVRWRKADIEQAIGQA